MTGQAREREGRCSAMRECRGLQPPVCTRVRMPVEGREHSKAPLVECVMDIHGACAQILQYEPSCILGIWLLIPLKSSLFGSAGGKLGTGRGSTIQFQIL